MSGSRAHSRVVRLGFCCRRQAIGSAPTPLATHGTTSKRGSGVSPALRSRAGSSSRVRQAEPRPTLSDHSRAVAAGTPSCSMTRPLSGPRKSSERFPTRLSLTGHFWGCRGTPAEGGGRRAATEGAEPVCRFPSRQLSRRERDNANRLELRPTCENCNRPLAPNATDAMICSYECTFCRDCAVLSNVCPNCGAGFERRPSGRRTRGSRALRANPSRPRRTWSTSRSTPRLTGTGRVDRRAVTLAALTPCAAQPK